VDHDFEGYQSHDPSGPKVYLFMKVNVEPCILPQKKYTKSKYRTNLATIFLQLFSPPLKKKIKKKNVSPKSCYLLVTIYPHPPKKTLPY
jgi:hypothetical protein